MRNATHYLLLGMVLLFFLPGCATLGSALKMGGAVTGYNNISDMGSSMEKSSREFNEEEKYYVGRTVAVTLMADDPVKDDKSLLRYTNAVGQTLVMACDRPEIFSGYRFAVLADQKSMNAYACPGGFLFISEKLLQQCQTEDELAAVLAHEIAHLVLDHPMQAIKASHQRAAMASLAKFGIRQASEQASELKQLSGVFNNVVKDVVKAVANGYSRDKESEADLMAVDILIRAGYSPMALANVLNRLDSKSCHHGDPKVRAGNVTQKVQTSGSFSVYEKRTVRFKKQVK
jgi:predicted Zn-dependent protease